MTKGLKVSEDLILPMEIVTQTQVILAKKGAGKTYTAAVEIEEALKLEQQVVVLDPTGAWWGLKSSAEGDKPGFPIAIFGGEHQDIPLEESAGEVVATAIVERQFSAVIDLSLFRKAQMHRFLVPFLETLYRINRHSLSLVVDEADFAAPQKPFGEEARTLGAMQDIVRRGRIRGLGCAMITQRPQVLNKDVLTQADMLVALRMNHPKDLAAVKEWVDVHADPVIAKEMIQSLPALPTGTAWFWAPGSDLLKKTQVRRRITFDSSATPKPGQRVKAPKALATVDIEKLGAEISATVQRAKENSPAELKAKIRRLEGEMAKKPGATAVTKEVADPKVLQENRELKARLADVRRKSEKLHAYVDNQVWPMLEKLKSGIVDLDVAMGVIRSAADMQMPIEPNRPVVPVRPTAAARTVMVAPPMPELAARGDAKPTIKLGARRMLAAMSGYYPRGLSEAQVALQAGMKKTSGTFGDYKSALKIAGYLEIRDGLWYATESGIAALGADAPQTPQTTEEVLARWDPQMKGKMRPMLERLIRSRGSWVTYADLAEYAQVSTDGGTFGDYLSLLRTMGLIQTEKGHARANAEALFLEAA